MNDDIQEGKNKASNEEKMNELLNNEEFIEKSGRCETIEETVKLFEEFGVQVSAEEIKAVLDSIRESDAEGDELSESEMEQVTGGTSVLSKLVSLIKFRFHQLYVSYMNKHSPDSCSKPHKSG